MLNLDKASLITAGRTAGKVIAVTAALPLVVISAVLEGEVGPITRSIVSKVATIGEYVGEIVAREGPHIARELFVVVKAAAYVVARSLKSEAGSQKD